MEDFPYHPGIDRLNRLYGPCQESLPDSETVSLHEWSNGDVLSSKMAMDIVPSEIVSNLI